MKNKIRFLFEAILVIALIIFYFNTDSPKYDGLLNDENTSVQLYTCGMHPDIISEEPGNCPICEMKLTPVKNKSTEREILFWRAPMDPNEIYNNPGKSKMGMDLVPVYSDETDGGGIVKIDPVVEQNMNIKTEFISTRILSPKIITNGIVKIDERSEFHVNSKLSGWIEKLYVNTTGQEVLKGEKLLDIYSPEIVAAQQEYLSVLKYSVSAKENGNSALIKSAYRMVEDSYNKLLLLDLTPKDIFKLENSGIVSRTIALHSPIDGTVLLKAVNEGQKISPGMLLFHFADLKNLWVEADIYENEISFVNIGSASVMEFNSYPGELIRTKISFINPVINRQARTTNIRLDLSNSSSKYKPGMLVKVSIDGPELAAYPLIPESAVIRSGNKNIAVIAVGKGKYLPAEIKLGKYSDGYYQVIDGLIEGNRVVTSAQFLIDSESNLKAALNQFSANDNSSNSSVLPDSTVNTGSKEVTNDHAAHSISTESKNKYGIESPLIRKGIIDAGSIDSNNDGKLYQCPMDWDIISDSDGRCPSCEMKLKEFSIPEVEHNLEEHGYLIKSILPDKQQRGE